MKSFKFITLILVAVFIVACGSDAPAVPEPTAVPDTSTISPTVVAEVVEEAVPQVEVNDEPPALESTQVSLSQITVPVTIYMLDDADGTLSTRRTAEEMDALIHQVNKMWGTANIIFNIQAIERISVPNDVIVAVGGGYIGRFFEGIGVDYDLPNPSTINIFFSRETGGLDGLNPSNTRTVFVRDETTGDTARSIARSLGHILNLHDIPNDTNRLMIFDGTGRTLTIDEIMVARYMAQGILDNLR